MITSKKQITIYNAIRYLLAIGACCYLVTFNNVHAQLPKNNPVFLENKGQVVDQSFEPRNDIHFYLNSTNYDLFVGENGMSYQLKKEDVSEERDAFDSEITNFNSYLNISRIDMQWIGANKISDIKKLKKSEYYEHHYTTKQDNGIKANSFKEMKIKSLYKGIDIRYYFKDGALEYDYEIARGIDYKKIEIKITGAEVSVNKEGALEMRTELGTIQESAPIAFQDGKEVSIRWLKKDDNLWGFEVDNLDHQLPLVIDPLVKAWGTYYGGSGSDQVNRHCMTSSEDIYITGRTSSGNNIATLGAHSVFVEGPTNGFVAKIDSSSTRLWGTYFGGNGTELIFDCSTDPLGNIYVVGRTTSTNGIATTGAFQTTKGNNEDGYIVKFSPTGTRLFGTYYGGNGKDQLSSIHATTTNFVVGGLFRSNNSSLTTSGAFLPTRPQGMYAGLIAYFNANGTRLWGSFYGGQFRTSIASVSIDNNGDIVAIGTTESHTGIATPGAHLDSIPTPIGFSNTTFYPFIVKFNSAGARQWGTYFGGGGGGVNSVMTDDSNNIYFAGSGSLSGNFTTPGAHNTTSGGSLVAKFSPTGSFLIGTFTGMPNSSKNSRTAAISPDNYIYIGGLTQQTQGIATPGAYQTVYGGGNHDGFIAKFNLDLIPQWCSYFGGENLDFIYGITAADSGVVYVSGVTRSLTDIATSNGHQSSFGGGIDDGYLAKLKLCDVDLPTELDTGCAGYFWEKSGQTYDTTGLYFHVVSNPSGCDSVFALSLYIEPPDTIYQTVDTCGSYFWPVDSQLYTDPGIYYATIIGSQNDCDTIVQLTLDLYDTDTTSSFVSSCGYYVWPISNDTLRLTGLYFNYQSNPIGCDSLHILTLVIIPNDTVRRTAIGCDSYFWEENGETYTQPGLYYATYTNQYGCDSIIELNLIFNPDGFETEIDIVACDSFYWDRTQEYYSESGTYQHTEEVIGSCDSTFFLNLTIIESVVVEIEDEAPEQYFWELTNETYFQSGVYDAVFGASNGCDSIIRLILTIRDGNKIYIPNAFVPNGRGVNDYFEVKGVDIVEYEIRIFSRWGEQIFYSNSLDHHWDGTFRGKECPIGVYTFIIIYTDSKGEAELINGSLTLIR